ncbi:MAG TPA: radical SAM family heme chaperone HemW [Candidatus Baltobacteraceae bacterium]|nr:radical SAM family heme chaperone HemW [Candidatus Baltobacteraceae bacterium]
MTAGIYVHLPFCPYICPYCDFAKWPHKRSAAARYLAALHEEIEASRAERGTYTSVFLGGGTPNTYAARDIADLIARLREAFPGPVDRETTVEVNPELVRPEDFAAYRAAGIDRVSIGVQSFVPQEIRTLGRRHTAEDVERVVRCAREAEMRSVSADLIFAVPGQTPQSWRRSLEIATALGVDHISAYGLTIEAGTPYEQWQAREPSAFLDDTHEADLYEIAMDVLEAAGFEQYEISNFARPGHRSAHNANYWANGEYAGLGVGAASYRGGVRSVHTRNLEEYVAAALEHRPIPGESEQLEGARRAGEAVMLALRTAQGVGLASFKERYGLDFLDFYASVVERYRSLGLLETDATHVRLTRRGRLLANDVCAAFVTFA